MLQQPSLRAVGGLQLVLLVTDALTEVLQWPA